MTTCEFPQVPFEFPQGLLSQMFCSQTSTNNEPSKSADNSFRNLISTLLELLARMFSRNNSKTSDNDAPIDINKGRYVPIEFLLDYSSDYNEVTPLTLDQLNKMSLEQLLERSEAK